MKKIYATVFLAGVTLALAALPIALGPLKADILVGFGISCLFAVSLNLLLESGLFSFGHAMFFGTGAYAAALGLYHLDGLPLVPAVFAGGLAAAFLGLLFSPVLLRAGGIYFTLLTVALNQIIYVTCLKFSDITGGDGGFSNYPIPPLNLFGLVSIPMDDKVNFYYFAAAVVVLCIWLMWFITKTPFGTIMHAIRDNPERIPYLGFWIQGNKTLIFVISAFFAGIAGALCALWIGLVAPSNSLHLVNVSIKTFLAILVGGLGTFIGPFIGMGVLLLFEELVVSYGQAAELVILAATITYLLYAPRYTPWGIVGILIKFQNKFMPEKKTASKERSTAFSTGNGP